jgi:hypothetical protein
MSSSGNQYNQSPERKEIDQLLRAGLSIAADGKSFKEAILECLTSLSIEKQINPKDIKKHIESLVLNLTSTIKSGANEAVDTIGAKISENEGQKYFEKLFIPENQTVSQPFRVKTSVFIKGINQNKEYKVRLDFHNEPEALSFVAYFEERLNKVDKTRVQRDWIEGTYHLFEKTNKQRIKHNIISIENFILFKISAV